MNSFVTNSPKIFSFIIHLQALELSIKRMMMHSEASFASWQQFPNFMDSAFSEFEHSDCSDVFPQFDYFPSKISIAFDFDDDPLQIDCPIEDFPMEFGELEFIESVDYPPPSSSSSQQIIVSEDDRDQWSPLSSSSSLKSDESSVTEASLSPQGLDEMMVSLLPADDKEIDPRLSLRHLMKAYGEAIENGQTDLADAISRRAIEMADPLGGPPERLAFNLFRQAQRQGDDGGDYLGQESRRNSEAAFRAFYQAFPFGRFAHFAANSAILSSAPRGAAGEVIRVVDFDLGEGLQSAAMIEAVAAQRDRAVLRLTAIKWDDDKDAEDDGRRFRDTSRALSAYAAELGVELKVEEMSVDELLSESRRGSAMHGRREWIAFNCMAGLIPDMGRTTRSRKLVDEFLAAAQEIVTANGRGIVTFAEGDSFEKLDSCTDFSEFFDRCLAYYQTLLDCMETELPGNLMEARLAMEALFVSPYVDASSWARTWEDARARRGVPAGIRAGTGGFRVSRESLLEARELVGGPGKSWYGVGIGERENEMVLQWRGTPLVRFSAWGM